MGMVPLYEWFPEVAETELFAISLCREEASRYGLPAAQYFCTEQVCPNADCDCNEILLTVSSERFSAPLAVLLIDLSDKPPNLVVEFAEASQSQHLDKIIRLVSDRLSRPPAIGRLRRHYELVKKRAARDIDRQRFLSGAEKQSSPSRRSRR